MRMFNNDENWIGKKCKAVNAELNVLSGNEYTSYKHFGISLFA